MSAIADSGKWYHTQASGPALNTVDQHAKHEATTLFASCFCPFVQRVWIAFEYLQIPYKVSELCTYYKRPLTLFRQPVLLSRPLSLPQSFRVLIWVYCTDEVDPYQKPQDLLEVSPEGLVPGLKLDDYTPPRNLHESTVIMEYLEE